MAVAASKSSPEAEDVELPAGCALPLPFDLLDDHPSHERSGLLGPKCSDQIIYGARSPAVIWSVLAGRRAAIGDYQVDGLQCGQRQGWVSSRASSSRL